jgi:hypothetical protein
VKIGLPNLLCFFDFGNLLTFLKEMDIVVGRELIQDISHRAGWNTVEPDLIMKMRARGPSACPNLSNKEEDGGKKSKGKKVK